MGLFSLVTSIKKKLVDPKVYAIVLRLSTRQSTQRLYVGAHYTYEEAIGAARNAWVTDEKSECMKNEEHRKAIYQAKPEMWSVLEIQELLKDVMNENVVKVQETDKNTLMKKIIESEDLKMLKENDNDFTAAEVEYMKKMISNKES